MSNQNEEPLVFSTFLECVNAAFKQWNGSQQVVISIDGDRFSVAVQEIEQTTPMHVDFFPTVQCDDIHVLQKHLEGIEHLRLIAPECSSARMHTRMPPTRAFGASVIPMKKALRS